MVHSSLPEGESSLEERAQERKSELKLKGDILLTSYDYLEEPCQKQNRHRCFHLHYIIKSPFTKAIFMWASITCNQDLIHTSPTISRDQSGTLKDSWLPGSLEFGHNWRSSLVSFPRNTAAPAAAKLLQSCLTLCDPMDCSLPGSSIHGIFQARVLEWGAIAFSFPGIASF